MCKPGWLWPLRMAKRCEWAGDERRRKAEHGGVGTPHSRGASGMVNETVCVLSFAHEVVQERLAADATPFVSCKSSRILAVRASWTVNAVAVY